MPPQPRLVPTIALSAALIGTLSLYAFFNRHKPIRLPKDLPAAQRTKHRRIGFTGARNVRDLGGYRTADGASVKWGVLYRADSLSKLTRHDLELLTALKLSRLIDFRADFEKEHEPNRLPPNPLFRVIELPVLDANSDVGNDLRQRIMDGNTVGIDPVAIMRNVNVEFVTHFTPEFRAFVAEVLAARGQPVLFHCTAGKDRTGFAAAILLRILDVPQTTVVEDYMISGRYALERRARDILMIRLTRGAAMAEIVRQFFDVDESYLQASFAAIDATYGSFAAYVRDGLGLSDADVAALREALVE